MGLWTLAAEGHHHLDGIFNMAFIICSYVQIQRFFCCNHLMHPRSAMTQFLSALVFLILTGMLSPTAAQSVLIVRNDLGGSIEERLSRIEQLRALGTRVEIRGTCASACTMLLGLPNACVGQASRLGFHGPQSQYYGVSLPRAEFEYWSQVLAAHYPATISDWFMKTARNTTLSLITISGKQAIKMGARPCGVMRS